MRLCDFVNEAYADFSKPELAASMQAALAQVRSQFGREHGLSIAGVEYQTGSLLRSLNPSCPSEVVSVHHKATPELAQKAIATADAFFPHLGRHHLAAPCGAGPPRRRHSAPPQV